MKKFREIKEPGNKAPEKLNNLNVNTNSNNTLSALRNQPLEETFEEEYSTFERKDTNSAPLEFFEQQPVSVFENYQQQQTMFDLAAEPLEQAEEYFMYQTRKDTSEELYEEAIDEPLPLVGENQISFDLDEEQEFTLEDLNNQPL